MLFFSSDPADLTVTIQSNVTVQEGDNVQLCVILDDIPAGGMDISVEIFLLATDSGDGKRTKSVPVNCSFREIFISRVVP